MPLPNDKRDALIGNYAAEMIRAWTAKCADLQSHDVDFEDADKITMFGIERAWTMWRDEQARARRKAAMPR